jgi:hypothetical protein
MAKKPLKEKSLKASPFKESNANDSFFSFLKSKEVRLDTILVLFIQIGLFIFLKIRFPYPHTETDSGNYILSAITGKINGYRPYGYSAFISFFAGISNDIQFLVTWQYLITALSSFLLLFTLQYFFRLNRVLFWLLAILVLFNPSVLFMNAYIMSDGLFVALTSLWLVSGVWIIMGGGLWIIPFHLLLMYWSIDTRYIGLFYPALSAIILFKRFLPNKALAVVGLIIPIIMLFAYRANQSQKMMEEFGYETFSAFGGWQKANNGVAVLPYVTINENEISDPEIKAVHKVVRAFPDSFFNYEYIHATSFMWVNSFPGKAFLSQYIRQSGTPYLKSWVYCGTLMDKYGAWLQAKFPAAYFKHYLLQNAKNIFTVWDINEGEKFLADQNMKTLFTTELDEYLYSKTFFRQMTGIRKISDVVAWVFFFVSIPAFFFLWRMKKYNFTQAAVLIYFYLFVFMFSAVSVYAAPINNFRYMMPIYYFQIALPILVLAGIFNLIKKAPNQ